MSRSEWVEIGGHRYTPGEIAQHTHVSYTCDGCGEFVAENAMVMVQDAKLVQWAPTPAAFVPVLYFHAEHVPRELAPYLFEGR